MIIDTTLMTGDNTINHYRGSLTKQRLLRTNIAHVCPRKDGFPYVLR